MAIKPCMQHSRVAEDVLHDASCIGTEGLVRLWAEVLEIPDVDAYDDFFNLGGNSLQAIQVLAGVSRLINLEFPTRVLYENPTPAAFHARLHAC